MKKYKVIFFDWQKTLSYFDIERPNNGTGRGLKRLVGSLFTRPFKRALNFLFVENDNLIQQWMRGDIDEERIIRVVADRFGYPTLLLRWMLVRSFKNVSLRSDEILPLIAKIRSKGILCVIATDNMDGFKKYSVPSLKLDDHFDDILVSYDMKVLKFDISEHRDSLPFFQEYLNTHHLTYADALLIDDKTDTTGVFQTLGFDTFQVTDTEGLLQKMRELTA